MRFINYRLLSLLSLGKDSAGPWDGANLSNSTVSWSCSKAATLDSFRDVASADAMSAVCFASSARSISSNYMIGARAHTDEEQKERETQRPGGCLLSLFGFVSFVLQSVQLNARFR